MIPQRSTKQFPEEAPGSGSLEAAVLRALNDNDRSKAIRLLMDAYGDAVYRFCKQMVGSDALSDDLHQTVFVQAYQDLPRYAGKSSLRVWLYGIARHRCLDASKMHRRWMARFVLADSLPDHPDERVDMEGKLVRRAIHTQLEDCLRQLPAKARAVLLLRYQQGFAYPQISDQCGERPATLQARVARALPILKRCLEAHGVAGSQGVAS